MFEDEREDRQRNGHNHDSEGDRSQVRQESCGEPREKSTDGARAAGSLPRYQESLVVVCFTHRGAV